MAPPDRLSSPRPGSGLGRSVLDLAQIRAMVESSGVPRDASCPTCDMPFDKGKKRCVIDSCGHERCYSCLFHSEGCPLCFPTTRDEPENAATSRWIDESSSVNSQLVSPRPHRSRHNHAARNAVVAKSSRGKPLAPPQESNSQGRTKMSQSCPTPPNQRKRFFLNPKVLKNSFAPQRQSRRGALSPEPGANDNPSAISAWMASSWEGKSRWPGVVLGKIKSLWNNSQESTSDGLNQLVGSTNDDEGSCVKPLTSKTRKSSQSDLYMRLGLLLGHGRANAGVDVTDLPGVSAGKVNPSAGQSRTPANCQESSAASFSSLASLDAQTQASTNTSPVSTLTGTSSEAEAAAALRSPSKMKFKVKGKSKDCDSAGSLASISTNMSMSMSVSVSGLSNASESPLASRRNSGQDEVGHLKNRRCGIRRSGRSGNVKAIADAKQRFAQHHVVQLTLKPLFFEVPLIETDPLFTGRLWLLHELESMINGSSPGTLISGSPGTGKTALVLQLVEHSCFGRRREQPLDTEIPEEGESSSEKSRPITSHEANVRHTNEKIRELASRVVAYHFCQADNNSTCLVPDLIHSLAAQLCQAPQLIAYREYLLSEPHLQASLSQRECTVHPDLALSRGIIEPLLTLKRAGKLPGINMVILIDAICEAEYHRPDRGDTIATFLARHAPSFPSWLKIVCTVRTQLIECAKQFPYTRLSLDRNANDSTSNNVTKDLSSYVSYRLAQSPTIQTNVTASVNGKSESSCAANQTRFASHLLTLAGGSFLFAKLTLDLIESGHLVAKSASYKVLPVSLAQIFLLHFNLRFLTATSFERVQPLLGVCLAALYPLTLPEIYYSVNSLNADQFISWEDFLQRFKMLSGFLVKRLDDTYMFFHPSFREWLMRRDDGESSKFLCDLRLGHAAIAFRLSRVQAPLDGERALELGHHILKAHVYRGFTPCYPTRDILAFWLTSSAKCISSALCTLRNIYSPNVKVSRLLLLAGASPDHVTEYLGDAPALCMYAHEGSVEMISLLLEFGANVELTNSQGCTALSLAAARGHCDVVRRLVAAGASLGHTDVTGQSPLVHAARHGRLSVVGYLLACDWPTPTNESEAECGYHVVGREEAAQQAVVAAASQGHESVVEYLLDMSEVTVDCVDTLIGETALTIATTNGSTATVSALLVRGADPSIVNTRGLSPLMLAAREGHWSIAERLLQGVMSSSTDKSLEDTLSLLEQRDLCGRTALMVAAGEEHNSLIDMFLEKGSAIEGRDKEGITALGWACVRGRLTAVQNLLDHGADVNTNDNTGRTPLDLAAFQGNPNLVQLLLDRGAVVEHVDLNGMRPLDRAIGCRNVPVVQCFLRRGAKLGPATWAMAAGKPDALLVLLNKLLEDGNLLYKKSRLTEASHRYAYALRKFPAKPEEDCQNQDYGQMMLQLQTFTQLRLNLLLNLSRVKRKINEYEEAIELADEALKLRPKSYEAFYARARARFDLGLIESALEDVNEAMQYVPQYNRQDLQVLASLKEELTSRLKGLGTSKRSDQLAGRSRKCVSVDTLTEL